MNHEDYIDVGLSKTADELQQRLIAFGNKLEFPLVSAVLVVKRPGDKSACVTRIGNTPEAFLEASVDEEDSKRDPVLQRMMSTAIPFTYDQSLYVGANAAELWEAQAAFGYHAGVQCAVHAGSGRHFLLGFDRDQSLPRHSEQLGRLIADVQCLTAFAQDAALRVLVPSEERQLIPKLTPRQLEVLRWMRDGKTLDEAAEILNISVNGLNSHLAVIRERFGVTSTRQAVVQAIRVGLV